MPLENRSNDSWRPSPGFNGTSLENKIPSFWGLLLLLPSNREFCASTVESLCRIAINSLIKGTSGSGEEEEEEGLASLDVVQVEISEDAEGEGVDGFFLFVGLFVLFVFAVAAFFVETFFLAALACFADGFFLAEFFFFTDFFFAAGAELISPITALVGGTPKFGRLLLLKRVFGIVTVPSS